MMKFKIAAAVLAIGAAFASAPASAAPLGLSATAPGAAIGTQVDPNLIEVRRRGGGGVVRGGRVGGRGVVRGGRVGGRGFARGGRGYGRGVGAAAVGIGILGAAAIAAGAAQAAPGCWWEVRPVYDRWGNYLGDRNTRVCN